MFLQINQQTARRAAQHLVSPTSEKLGCCISTAFRFVISFKPKAGNTKAAEQKGLDSSATWPTSWDLQSLKILMGEEYAGCLLTGSWHPPQQQLPGSLPLQNTHSQKLPAFHYPLSTHSHIVGCGPARFKSRKGCGFYHKLPHIWGMGWAQPSDSQEPGA